MCIRDRASAISNPNTAYVVFSVNGKTLVKKVKGMLILIFQYLGML